MKTKIKNTDTDAAAKLAGAHRAHLAALERFEAARAASAAADRNRPAFGSSLTAIRYELTCAEIAVIESRAALEAAAVEAKRAGAGHPLEVDPRAWNLAGLAAQIAPLAEEVVNLREREVEIQKQAADILERARVERDAVAAARPAGDPLGAPPPVPERLYAVALELELQGRAGAFKPEPLARAAGWVSGVGAGEVPPGLGRDELVDAVLAGVRPAPKNNASRLARLRADAAEMERTAAREAAEAEARKARQAEAEREHEREKRAQEARAKADGEAWRAKCEAEAAAAAKLAEAGRKALRGAA